MGISRWSQVNHEQPSDSWPFWIPNYRKWWITSCLRAHINKMLSKINSKERNLHKKSLQLKTNQFKSINRYSQLLESEKNNNSFRRKIKVLVYSTTNALWIVHWKHHILWRIRTTVYLVHCLHCYQLSCCPQNSWYWKWN